MKAECPHCGQHYEVDKLALDQVAECTSCGQEFWVEAMPGEQSEPPASPSPNSADAPDLESPESETPMGSSEQPSLLDSSIDSGSAPASTGLKVFACEMCGSSDLIKKNGVFVCQFCGTKYTAEEAKKMIISGTVKVAGTVKVDMSEKLQNLYKIARRAKDEENNENAAKYYDLILQEDPDSWEASYYSIYFKAMSCKIAEICSAAVSVYNCLRNVLDLVIKHERDEKKRLVIFSEITEKTASISSMLGNAAINHFNGIDAQIRVRYNQEFVNNVLNSANVCYYWGDLLEPIPNTAQLSDSVWKIAINFHSVCVIYCADKNSQLVHIQKYAEKIKRTEPDYKMPAISTGGCYVATAVYGSYDCPEVWVLRRFRDDVLASRWYGRAFIRFYYATSPTLVKYFGKTNLFAVAGRKTLDRLVQKLKKDGVASTPYNDVIRH